MDQHNADRAEGIPNGRFEPDRYYRPADAALAVIASRGTLATWRWAGRGPRFTKFGHRILSLGADLNAWLDMHLVEPTIRATTQTSRAGGDVADSGNSRRAPPGRVPTPCAGLRRLARQQSSLGCRYRRQGLLSTRITAVCGCSECRRTRK